MALLDGAPLDWEAAGKRGAADPAAWEALRILDSVRNIYNPDAGIPEDPAAAAGAPAARLEFLDEIGAGSFGRVMRARDRVLQREIAVKITKAEGVAGDVIFREARALARVEHPNIVRIYNVSRDAENVYIEMEYVDGERLDRFVKRAGPASPVEAARIGAEVAAALKALHADGVVHGDLKPANIMRRTDGRVVLLDFGLSRTSDPRQRHARGATRGTPIVMAPEQLESDPSCGPRSDLYSLAVVMYFLVSGRFPFEAGDVDELRARVLGGMPVPLIQYAPGVPRGFVEIVERGLARRQRDRFPTAADMGAACGEFLSIFEDSTKPVLCDIHLFVHRPDGEMRLSNGGEVRLGDRLSLEVTTDKQATLYVFNEDKAGDLYLLFPLPGVDLKNPLPAGTHGLPGRRGGARLFWTVTSHGGGEERILIIASRAPVADVEKFIKRARVASESTNLSWPRLTIESRQAVLRGIGGLAPESNAGAATAAPRRRASSVDSLVSGVEGRRENAGAPWWRMITLRNRGV